MPNIEGFTERLSTYIEPDHVKRVRRAYFFAEQAHEGQTRKSGEPYITHPLAAANIMADLHVDHDSLMACLLHDVIEDTPVSKETLAQKFGDTVAEIVDGVSKLTKMETRGETVEEQQAENILKMTLAMSKDIRVILVKLADRLHNMRTLDALPPPKRRRIAKETLEIYAPIAQRLGLNAWRLELEDLGFKAHHPMRARLLNNALTDSRQMRKYLVDEIQDSIIERFDQEDFSAKVIGREKHLYSIYRKMRDKHLHFRDIMDVFAFRVIVDTVDQCYRAIGVLHNLFKPTPGQFKDYIAIPKANGYQSLHTILVGRHGIPIEIQVRTHEMDDMANYGIAAHWHYKESGSSKNVSYTNRFDEWVQGLVEIQQQAGSSLEFIEHLKTDLFPDEVYVFTPKGRIIQLPAGATAVDFAYAVHTNVGNTCVGCKINNLPSPLSQALESGQRVEIVRSKLAQPHPGWLDFVVTARARSAIRHGLKNRRHEESVYLGRRLLNKMLSSAGSSLDEISEARIQTMLADTHHKDFDEVLEQIGLGNLMAYAVAKILIDDVDTELPCNRMEPVVIDSADAHVISFGGCCQPIPGDEIVGYFSAGRGLVVHIERCRNVASLLGDAERTVRVDWAPEIQGDFATALWVDVTMSRGSVAELASRISSANAGVDGITVEDRSDGHTVIKAKIRVHDRKHLSQVIRRVRGMPSVSKVKRGTNS